MKEVFTGCWSPGSGQESIFPNCKSPGGQSEQSHWGKETQLVDTHTRSWEPLCWTSGMHPLHVLTGPVLFQVSEQLLKAPASSMGEMTTTDTSSRPSSEDSKHALPKKPGLTEGVCATDAGPREASQPQLTTPLPSTDKGSKVQEGYPGKVEAAASEEHKAGPEEPMELDIGHWRKPSTTTDSQGNRTEAETSLSAAEPQPKVTDSSRTAELSLEELSISSRQQQPQASAPKVTLAASGAEQGLLRRPNRKRKLLEDIESGKTLLLDAYRVWQQGQKVMTYDLGRIEKIMSETYMLIKQVYNYKMFHTTWGICAVHMYTVFCPCMCCQYSIILLSFCQVIHAWHEPV